MAVFICGINPAGAAHKTGQLQVGDEILEVNGKVLHERSHLNASALIRSLPDNTIKIIALRCLSTLFFPKAPSTIILVEWDRNRKTLTL